MEKEENINGVIDVNGGESGRLNMSGYWDSAQQLLVGRCVRYWEMLPVLVEVLLLVLVLYVGQAVLYHDMRIKHSALLRQGIYRVGLDREKPRDHNAKKFFQNQHGLWIHYCTWHSKQTKPKGIVLFLHGHSEHVNRHEHTAQVLADAGYVVYGIDHQGFGRSEGDRGHVEKFQHYIDDILLFMTEVWKTNYAGTPYEALPRFIFSHSMGSLINILTTLQLQNSTEPWHKVRGIILGSPAIHLSPKTNNVFLLSALRLAAYLVPKFPLIGFPSDPTTSFLQTKMHSQFDPLNYHEKLRPHQVKEMIDATLWLKDNFHEFDTPVLIFHGTVDPTCDIEGSRAFFNNIKSKDKELFELQGLTHEPLQEVEHIRKPVYKKIISWLDTRSLH